MVICGLAALGFAADLNHQALPLMQRLMARHNLALWQEGQPIAADIDQRRSERRHKTAHPAEMDAASFAAVAALDKEFDGYPVFEQRRAPFAGGGGDQQRAVQLGR